jgi:hypothetical protein
LFKPWCKRRAVDHLGTTIDGVEIIIYEVPREHWALAGRLPDESPSPYKRPAHAEHDNTA